jgi:hypothetical protein
MVLTLLFEAYELGPGSRASSVHPLFPGETGNLRASPESSEVSGGSKPFAALKEMARAAAR